MIFKGKEIKLINIVLNKYTIIHSFWPTLFLDTLPLLETEDPVISSEDTYELMLQLELHSKCLAEEKAELLRLALARNLARTALLDDL